jgi:hypothetical protein
MIEFDIKVPDNLRLLFENEEGAIAVAADRIRAELTTRLEKGVGARGTLPNPKDGGQAMQRSGRVLSSIGVVIKKNRKSETAQWIAFVRALGDRPAQEVGNKRAAAREKQRQLRAAASIGFALASLTAGGQAAIAKYRRKKQSKDGQAFRLGGLRIRAGLTNASVAAILSQPPVDKRARNGQRKQYRVFESNETYERIARDVLFRFGKFRVVAR